MAKKDPRIDAFIAKAEPFARPILKHLRKVVHRGAPDVDETIKWGMPHFDVHGASMAGMAAFKAHCSFGFWKASLLGIPRKKNREQGGMGTFGRITSLSDLPSEANLIATVKKAAALNAKGTKVARPKPRRNQNVAVPSYLKRVLGTNKKALATFEGFSPSHRREYVDWLEDAKTDETRRKRLETAVTWLAQGKSRHWKYQRK